MNELGEVRDKLWSDTSEETELTDDDILKSITESKVRGDSPAPRPLIH